MADVSLRVPALLDGVEWPAWRAAGITAVQVASTALAQSGARPEAAGIAVVPEVRLVAPATCERLDAFSPRAHDARPPRPPESDAGWPAVVIRALTPDFALRHLVAARVGSARVCGLDVFVAATATDDSEFGGLVAQHGGDPNRVAATTHRYLTARQTGYAPAELPASENAVGLLYGADAPSVIAARAQQAARSARQLAGQARNYGAARVIVELDPLPADYDAQLRAVTKEADELLVVAPAELRPLLRSALRARDLGVSGVVIDVPSDAVGDAERLADALDLIDGVGLRHAVLETNSAWLESGAELVGRAVHRLTGRSGTRDAERRRRTELLEA